MTNQPNRRPNDVARALAFALMIGSGCGEISCDIDFPLGAECHDPASGKPNVCADESLPPGTFGGPCRKNGDPCTGGRCWANTCLPCGGPEEVCCEDPLDECQPGGVCAKKHGYGDPYVCRTDCGGPDQNCCPQAPGETEGRCEGELKCFYGTCLQQPVTPSCGGSTNYEVLVVDNLGCYRDLRSVWADSEQDALDCAAQDILGTMTALEAGPVGSYQVSDYLFCDEDFTYPLTQSHTEPHVSLEMAEACMAWSRCNVPSIEDCDWYYCG